MGCVTTLITQVALRDVCPLGVNWLKWAACLKGPEPQRPDHPFFRTDRRGFIIHQCRLTIYEIDGRGNSVGIQAKTTFNNNNEIQYWIHWLKIYVMSGQVRYREEGSTIWLLFKWELH